MSASFYDLLRYAKTGIAAPDMTAFDKQRAIAMAGGAKYPVATITGVPPISFRSDGSPLISWSMLGNGRQEGTPTPEFVGVRTGNLFDKSTAQLGYRVSVSGVVRQEDTACSDFIFVHGKTFLYASNKSTGTNFYFFKEDKTLLSYVNAFNAEIPSDAFYVRVNLDKTAVDTYMLNDGSTALPFEPYGYKISIVCAGQTTKIYIGDPLRKAIDGTNAVDVLSSAGTITRAVDADGNALATPTTQTIDVPPAIQTVRGSNVLTVDTNLQPSSVSITGHIKQA